LGIALLIEKLQRLTTLIVSMVGKKYLDELNCHISNTGFRADKREEERNKSQEKKKNEN